MNDPEAHLAAAIEAAYEAFAAYPLPRVLNTSPLRDPKAILRQLSSAPLRDLSDEAIGPYSGWALTTVGNDLDYRHFLPRIFELAVADPAWLGCDPPVLADKLEYAYWRSWPLPEREVVIGYFRAAHIAMIARHPDMAFDAALWLCGLVKLGEPLAEAFGDWFNATSPNAALQLARFVNEQAPNWRRSHEVRGPWWDGLSPALRHEIARELMSERSRAKIEGATDASDEDRFYLIDAALIEMQRTV